ncbi:MAG: AAA family ATPase [Proteobacteria bacterium]|nr:AAA family ATPase [Pseudomonadota bacterium]MBU4471769.1 AAA family ATPase [Pseudomonadota bacterium]MCG2750550.1 AAA family ATPase [Desulfobacteraceae bacterium]
MYAKYFGFRERPFKLVPNPHYLYLSKSHEEALAHLTYAVSQGDGFLTITGEVGTGKTTLCRSFIESLDPSKVIAYIFNPRLDALQLLKAINDEFEIPSHFDNTKDLIDELNRFLIEKKQEGKTVILLIDEAQNLRKGVLEQIRLLSNLETSKDKLLQIILVGQPELIDILETRELRQLAQRITLSFHLMPLDGKDVGRYIEHRINLASQKPEVLFSKSAIRMIHQFSNGIPRIINMVCDRALLTASVLNKKAVNQDIVRTAIRELAGKGKMPSSLAPRLQILVALFLLCTGVFLVMGFYPEILGLRSTVLPSFHAPAERSGIEEPKVEPPGNKASTPEPLNETTSAVGPEPTEKPVGTLTEAVPLTSPFESPDKPLPPLTPSIPVQEDSAPFPQGAENKSPEGTEPQQATESPSVPADHEVLSLDDYLKTLDILNSRQTALATVLSLWKTETSVPESEFSTLEDDGSYFVLASRKNGFFIQALKNNFDLAKRMNLPFILEIYWPEKMALVYLAVTRMENQQIFLAGRPGDKGLSLSGADLKKIMGETAYIPWKNFYGYDGIIPGSAPADTVLTLKMHLRDMGFSEIEINGVYDYTTRKVIQTLQRKYQIQPDGLVGPLTKIALYNETPSLNMPHISN